MQPWSWSWKAFSKVVALSSLDVTDHSHTPVIFNYCSIHLHVWEKYEYHVSYPNETFWVRSQLSEGNVALFWSRGVDVLINMPAASLGRSRKRGDLVKERDGTRWNAMECLSILPRLAYTSECSLEWELHTHTLSEPWGTGSQESVNCTGNCCDCLTPKSGWKEPEAKAHSLRRRYKQLIRGCFPRTSFLDGRQLYPGCRWNLPCKLAEVEYQVKYRDTER